MVSYSDGMNYRRSRGGKALKPPGNQELKYVVVVGPEGEDDGRENLLQVRVSAPPRQYRKATLYLQRHDSRHTGMPTSAVAPSSGVIRSAFAPTSASASALTPARHTGTPPALVYWARPLAVPVTILTIASLAVGKLVLLVSITSFRSLMRGM